VFAATGFLMLGLFFLIINKSRLMFVCLGCSAAICFVKNEMNEQSLPNELPPRHPPVEMPLPNRMRDSAPAKSILPDESAKTRR
jgi:hypothetical protein